MANILLLEETATLRREFTETLICEGHRVLEAQNIEEFTAQMLHADIAMIDLDLPGGEAHQAVQRLRKVRPDAGLVLLTARGSVDDKIKGLRSGADHYLTKPIPPQILSAYITTIVRRLAGATGGKTMAANDAGGASVTGWRLDLRQRCLCAPGGPCIDLSTQEMTLIHLLAHNAGKPVHRRSIASAYSTDWRAFDEHRLDQLVSRLRKRWRQLSDAALPLQTKRGQGYLFDADIDIR